MRTKDLHLYKQIHKEQKSYGDTANHHYSKIKSFILDNNPKTILDFGCGKGKLQELVSRDFEDVLIHGYDPAIEGKEEIILSNYDMVITNDVLEHLYEDEIEFIVKEILDLKPKTMHHFICCRPAITLLPDGTNAHKTVKDEKWWLNKILSIVEKKGYLVNLNSGYHEVYLK